MAKLIYSSTGEDMTRTILDFVQSGQFYNAIEILREGGIPNDVIKGFLLNKYVLTGSTEDKEGLQMESVDNPEGSHLFDGWLGLAETFKITNSKGGSEVYPFEPWDFKTVKYLLEKEEFQSAHLKTLFSLFEISEFIELFKFDILDAERYVRITLEDQTPINSINDGVILQDGSFIEVPFEGHRDLYPILEQLGLSDNDGDDWGHSEKLCVRISDRRVCGIVINSLRDRFLVDDDVNITSSQVDALYKWREHFPNLYNSRSGTVMDCVRRYIIKKHDRGTKYGNLMFLKRFTNTQTPEVSNSPMKGTYALRTSPKDSMAGVLDSVFNVTKHTHNKHISEMMDNWEKYSDVVKGNELHIFSQEILEGKNGVCHYRQKGDWEYSVSKNRGDVVRGIKSKSHTDNLSNCEYDYLRKLSGELYVMLGEQIQLEFVCNENGVHIVQLRTLSTPVVEEFIEINDKNIIGRGLSFNSGYQEVKLSDTLVVDNQCDSKELIGKKCLIVRDKVNFSHVLTFSETLNIPSILGVGDIDLPETFHINTNNRSGIIYTPK